MIGMDLAEQSNAESMRSASYVNQKSCTEWVNSIGMRLFCRKLISEQRYKENSNLSDADTIILSIKDVLRISPFEPAYWLALADMELLANEDMGQIIEIMRMSYVTGRSYQMIMQHRLSIMMGLWQELTESDKSIAVNDYVYASPKIRSQLIQSYKLMSAEQRSELFQTVMRKEPRLGDNNNLNLKFD